MRKAGRGILIALGALLALVLLAIVGALVWLHTGGGARELGTLITREAASSIQGKLTVRAIHVGGFLRICAEGVDLRDPDGHRVIAADSACVNLNPIALKAKKIVVREASLTRPWIEIASETDEKGEQTTTLKRALAPKNPKPEANPGSGQFAWTIDVAKLVIDDGHVAIRPGVGEPATFALGSLQLGDTHAKYSASGGDVALGLSAQLAAPGEAPLALQADAALEGAAATGRATVRTLRVKLGDSGFAATGAYDLGRATGELHVRDLTLTPRDLAAVMPRKNGEAAPPLLSGRVRGEADVTKAPQKVTADVRLQAGGGTVSLKGNTTLGIKAPEWDVALGLEKVDPGDVSPRAPHGNVTAFFKANGKGVPKLDQHGIEGDLEVALHVGPAQLDRVGPVVTELKADLDGRRAIIRAFTATALGLEVKAKGDAAFDAVALDVEVNAPSLTQVSRAVAALTRKPGPPMAGTLRLRSRVTGAPMAPDARLHLRAPWLRWGPTISADGLAVDGTLKGSIERPNGALVLAARRLNVGDINVGAPRINMGVEWPVAHLRLDAGVKNGSVQVAGDARIDDDKDGLSLSNLVLAWPENQLRLAHDTRVHLRDEIILEPLELTSPHGALRVAGTLRSKTPRRAGTVDAQLALASFDLAYLPKFVIPQGDEPQGVVDATATVKGALPHPDVDARLEVRGAGLRRLDQLGADAHVHAVVHGGRLTTDGWLHSPSIARLEFQGDLPLAGATLPPNAPVQFDLTLTRLDLAELGRRANIASLQRSQLQGLVDMRVLASGTLNAPRATLALDVRDVATSRIKGVAAHTGLLLENGSAALDGDVALGGARILAFTGKEPLDLSRMLRDREYLKGAGSRPFSFDLAITQLDLHELATQGVLPEDSAGVLSLGVHLGGTPLKPALQVSVSGKELSAGRLRGLDVQGQFALADDVKLNGSATSQGIVVARLDASAAISSAELIAYARSGRSRAALEPLLDRALSLNLDVPGLPIARASQLAGRDKSIAEGRIVGHIGFSGTAARPTLTGKLDIQDLSRDQKKLGSAGLSFDANSGGALVHLGIDPPGGGNFVGQAQVKAELGARALLDGGAAALRDAPLTGTMRANKLDLAFLGGIAPNLRRAAGTLDGNVELGGTVRRPNGTGEAHLRRALFDIVGQGVFNDIGLDAKFSPKEVVIDRLTGSSGDGTFSAILVASRKVQQDGPDKIEFTGEIHIGDDESARDRTTPDGKAVHPGPMPIRQAGDQRADVTVEVDLFGDYTDSVLTVDAKIPDARVKVLQLPSKKLPSLKENPDIILVHGNERPHPPGREPGDVEKEQEALKTATFRVHAHLNLNHAYVQAPDFEFPVQADMRFFYSARSPDAPTADGTVHIPQGSFSALGRRFVIDDAKITETGGDLANPELEIKAIYENPNAVVTVTVTGTAKDPQLELSSNPPMDQDAIAFFLATGRIQGRATQQGGGIDLSSAATSVLGGILFGQLRKELASVLPVDVLTIETGDKGVSMASVGKYIGDRVYVGYTARLTPAPNENTQEGRVEYEISRTINAEATVGDKNQDVSILWTKDF